MSTPVLRTLFPILYSEAGMGMRVEIPQGTPVVRAEGFPRECYWAQPWEGMTKREREYGEVRGYIILGAEVGPDLPGFSGA